MKLWDLRYKPYLRIAPRSWVPMQSTIPCDIIPTNAPAEFFWDLDKTDWKFILQGNTEKKDEKSFVSEEPSWSTPVSDFKIYYDRIIIQMERHLQKDVPVSQWDKTEIRRDSHVHGTLIFVSGTKAIQSVRSGFFNK